MADTKEADSKRKVPAKKGLHGWKAALAVFGCGSLAAFLVFGLVVGVASLFLSSVREGFSGATSGGAPRPMQTGEPVVELKPGEMDLCAKHIEFVYGSGSSSYESGNYEDPALSGEAGDRIVSDTCNWEVYPGLDGMFEPWAFEFSYEAVIEISEDGHPDDVASSEYDALVDEVPGKMGDVISSDDAGHHDRSQYFYGTDEGGNYVYYLVGQSRSAVYVIHYESPSANDPVRLDSFNKEADNLIYEFETGFRVLIPD